MFKKVRIDNLSYRIKVPLSLTLAILFSGLFISAILLSQAEKDFRRNLFEHANDLGAVLARSVSTALKHDDLWQAYQVLKSASNSELGGDRLLVVLDNDSRIYLSNQPRSFPIQSDPVQQSVELGRLVKRMERKSRLVPYVVEESGFERYYIVYPMLTEGIKVADLIIGYHRSLITPRLHAIYWQVTMTSLLVILILIPIGWRIGQRMTRPLIQLRNALSQIGRMHPHEIICHPLSGSDEIGELNRQFQQMLAELSEKDRLENQMVARERLAAIGQISSGVAHEINNPLGGLLNTIKTLRKFGQQDPMLHKMIDLLERGLAQIKDIVSALLVEAKGESHPLTVNDVEDVMKLLLADAHSKRIGWRWQNEISETISLPSTPVRQILMNLGLNAIHASPVEMEIIGRIHIEQGLLVIEIINQGITLDTGALGRMFEPFIQGDKGSKGSGLGLWITFQLVQQLGGEIEVESESGTTRFKVILPLMEGQQWLP